MASAHYLSNQVLRRKKTAAASPATFDRLQIGVGVIFNEVLNEMLRYAEDQSAILPLDRGQRSQRYMLRHGTMSVSMYVNHKSIFV